MSMHNILSQAKFKSLLLASENEVKSTLSKATVEKLTPFQYAPEFDNMSQAAIKRDADARTDAAREISKTLARKYDPDNPNRGADLAKAGVTTALGFNFYDLRGPAMLLYPVNVPFRNMLPRIGRVNDGVGVAANWKASRNPGFVYAGVTEGQRNAIATPDENNYIASYKELGIERAATLTSQFAAEGYTDIVADEHIRGMHELWLQEEGLMLLGNSGTASGNNGFALGTAPMPTGVLGATTTGSLASGTSVSAAVVLLTALGNPKNNQYGYGVFPTVAAGLTPSYTRTNADGSTDTINGGMSAISAMSTVNLTTVALGSVTYSVTGYPNGTFSFAWFVNTTDTSAPTLANARLAGITTTPSFTVKTAATGTQAGNAAGLSTDHSFNTKDFDGLLTYAASTAGAYWNDLKGASFSSAKDGSVPEIETALQYIWDNYQGPVSTIWASSDAAKNIDRATQWGGSNGPARQVFITRDQQNNVLAGSLVSAYQSRYSMSPTGAAAIPIRIHPMLPVGTIYFDVADNPYPHSRTDFVRGMLVQRDYYSIEWPIVTRQWTFGTYVHEVLAHHFPWMTAVVTGIGTFVGS